LPKSAPDSAAAEKILRIPGDCRPQDATWVAGAIHRLASTSLAKPNSVNNWAVFLASPR